MFGKPPPRSTNKLAASLGNNSRASGVNKQSSSQQAICQFCPGNPAYGLPFDFIEHLRRVHCSKEGGSYVCKYGANNLCTALPFDGVSDKDYEEHVNRVHLMTSNKVMDQNRALHSSESSRATSPEFHNSMIASTSSTTSLTSLMAPSVVQDTKQKSYDAFKGTQSLSSVLSDPRKSKREISAFFTRDHGESFTMKDAIPPSIHLKKIKPKNFESYLMTVGKKHRRHLRDEKRLAETQRRRDLMIDEEDLTLATYQRISANLTQIPKLFLSSKFTLDHQTVFESVFLQEVGMNGDDYPNDRNPFGSESSSSTPLPSPERRLKSSSGGELKSKNPFEEVGTNPFGDSDEFEENDHGASKKKMLRPNRLLQEKLSEYLDIVESEIGMQIASRSQTFFKAMASHDELQTHLATTKYAVQHLRNQIGALDTNFVQKSLKLLSLHRKRSNKSSLLDKLELISTVKETQGTVQVLLHSYDFLGALDVIATTQDILKEELKGIIAFRHLSLQLSELQNIISKMIKEEFVKYIKAEMAPSSISEESHLSIEQETLSSLILGMLRVKEYRFVQVLKDEISLAAKNVLKEVVRSKLNSSLTASGSQQSDTDTGGDGMGGDSSQSVNPASLNVNLGDELRKMTLAEWMHLMRSLFLTLNMFSRKTKAISDVILDLLDIAGGRCAPPSTPFSALPQPTHLHTPLRSEIDVIIDESDYYELREGVLSLTVHSLASAQERLNRVLTARAKDGYFEKLQVDHISELINLFDHYSDEAQSIAGVGLKIPLTLKQGLHSHLIKWVNKWADDRKTKLGNILDSEHWKAADVPELFQTIMNGWTESGCGQLKDVEVSSAGTTASYLVVNDEQYVLVGTCLMLVQMMAQYCDAVRSIPSLAPELLTKLIALASRCLSLVAKLIPSVQSEFESHLPTNQVNLKRHFHQVSKDYDDHIQEIFNKLLSVMDHHICSCLNKWEIASPAPSTCFKQIAKHYKRFYDGLMGILPHSEVQKLFFRIHDVFKERFKVLLIDMEITPNDPHRYGFVCSEFSFYMESLQSIPPCTSIQDTLAHVYSFKGSAIP